MTECKLHPRIYVASLADYVAGRLHGCWIDATQPPETIEAEVVAMLNESVEPLADEWAIHDFDDFGEVRLGEWESFERVSELACALVEYGPAFGAWYSFGDYDEGRPLVEQFEESYRGEFDDLGGYAYGLATDIGDVTETQLERWPFTCIDWQHAGRELDYGGDIWTADTPDGRKWVFGQ